MTSPFLGSIMTAGFNFAPRGYATCSGQIMSIAQNTALFSLLGTTYGGNGQTTFALPDLRGRVPIGQGQGPGLSSYSLGQISGTENTTLTQLQMPQHVHVLTPVTLNAVNVKASEQAPQIGAFLGRGTDTAPMPDSIPEIYVPASAASGQTQIPLGGVNTAANTAVAGGSQPFSILQPYLTLMQCIAVSGIFPSRN